MSMTYLTWQNAVANLAATDLSDDNFRAIIPAMIDYAEQRIYRDLNLVATRVVDTSKSLTPNYREFDLPTDVGTFVTVTGINVITPAGADITSHTNTGVVAKRNALASMTRNLVDYIAQSEIASSSDQVPYAYYMRDANTIIVGPSPGSVYQVEVVGTIRPTPLSSSNPTTYLTTYLPDLFLAASMVFLSGYMRNFGSQADDPKMSVSWESQYNTLLASANAEEERRRYSQEVNTRP